MAATARKTRTKAKETKERLTLDGLAAMSPAQLARVYAAGTVPGSLAELNGDREGRMLAVRGAGKGFVARRLAQLAKSKLFPWEGKRFTSKKSAKTGKGVNRVKIAGRLFPFETTIRKSPRDGRLAIALNYDLPANPAPIRRIYDELREVAPGVFLGPSLWKTAKGYQLLLWFAVA